MQVQCTRGVSGSIYRYGSEMLRAQCQCCLLFAVCHTAQRMPAVIARRKPLAHERGVRYDRFVLLVVQPNRSRALCGLL